MYSVSDAEAGCKGPAPLGPAGLLAVTQHECMFRGPQTGPERRDTLAVNRLNSLGFHYRLTLPICGKTWSWRAPLGLFLPGRPGAGGPGSSCSASPSPRVAAGGGTRSSDGTAAPCRAALGPVSDPICHANPLKRPDLESSGQPGGT